MNIRLTSLLLFFSLTAVHYVSAETIQHELSGTVSFSQVSGVSTGDPFLLLLTYDTNQPDLLPADLNFGRYGEFTLSLDVGPISVSQPMPAPYALGIINGLPGSDDRIAWSGSIGVGDIGLSASDPTGTVFDSDAIPTSLDISRFASMGFRHFVTGSTRIDGRVLSVVSRSIPEPASLALFAVGICGFIIPRPTIRKVIVRTTILL